MEVTTWPTVAITTSGLVPFAIEHCWAVARDFGQICKLFDGMEVGGRRSVVRSGMLDGAPGTCIGALRYVDFGTIRLIQQLDCVDNEAHKISWHAVAHPLNRSEFPGSFVNDSYGISMKPVSMNNATYVELRGKFMTEPENVTAMIAFLDNMQETAVGGITRCLVQSTLQPSMAQGLGMGPGPNTFSQQQQPGMSHPVSHQMGPAAHMPQAHWQADQSPSNSNPSSETSTLPTQW
ncbi:hypothetical protein WJX84_001283 [Apatococcus fuscideae]|uniref:Uncharacterized protein n=1 Tax=Apatococcus fuscideae TaxID=2026836 RepID=A0AAW1SXM5_9CHLO